MRQTFYFFKTALENMQINKMMAFFSLISLSLTLMLFGFFLLFYYNIQNLFFLIREDVHFSVYLSEGLGEEAVAEIKRKLSADERILSFDYISKEKALEFLDREFQGKAIVESLGENPLPASFEVKVKAPYQEVEKLVSIIEPIRKYSGVDEVQYGSDWLKNLNHFLGVLRIVGIGFGGFLGIAVMTIIANTIRLHFYNRKEEIEIMRLIGATHRFIKIPFFMEGSLMGLISGGVAVLMLFVVFYFSGTHLESIEGVFHGILEVQFLPIELLLGLIVGGGMLGGIGSVISLAHLLKLRTQNDANR